MVNPAAHGDLWLRRSAK